MMLITDEYKRLNAQLHRDRGGYGSKGGKWAPRLVKLARQLEAKTILDYGCGKGSLKHEIDELMRKTVATLGDLAGPVQVLEYDPAIEGKASPPGHADLVVCTDVLEHVEPECIDDVLRHLVELADKAVMIAVACRPGKRVLADGRPDHLTVQPPAWWEKRLSKFGTWRTIPSLREREHCAVLVK